MKVSCFPHVCRLQALSQGKPFWKSHDGMHLHSDTDTYFGGGSQKFGGKTPQRHHRREVEGYDGGNHSDRASHLFNNNTSVPSSKKTGCDGLSQNSAPQRKTGLSMFITIIHYFYLLEWPQQWGAIHRSIGIPCFWRNPSQQRCQFPRLMAPNAPGNLQDSASQQIRQARGKGDRLQAWRRDHRYHTKSSKMKQNWIQNDTETKMIQK